MWTWNSDPFGTDAANPNPAGAGTFAYNLRFPGQLFDGQAGLHYNDTRFLDPATGTYETSDLLGLDTTTVYPRHVVGICGETGIFAHYLVLTPDAFNPSQCDCRKRPAAASGVV